MTDTRKHALMTTLAKTRRHCSLIEQEMALVTGDITRQNVKNRLVFVDAGNRVTSDCGQMEGTRAISTQGQLGWVVRHQRGEEWVAVSDPFEAFDDVARGIFAGAFGGDMRNPFSVLRQVGRKIPFFSAP
ncbi:hypothetical protein [Actibacterium mucosum]|nr:hypothetical protein [Actibacterium mucosum]